MQSCAATSLIDVRTPIPLAHPHLRSLFYPPVPSVRKSASTITCVLQMLDAFAGIGGFRLAALKASQTLGIDIEFPTAIEWDLDSRKTYADNFGYAHPILGDITQIDFAALPDHDILTGGFPCQPFSRNGKFYNKNGRVVGDDDRANLFLNLCGILQTKKPKAFIFENVKGLTLMKNKDGSPVLATILRNIEGCGYVPTLMTLDSADYGLPQQRKRIFFVGLREDLAQQVPYPEPFKGGRLAVEDILEPCADKKYFIEFLWRNRKLISDAATGRDGKKGPNHPFPKGSSRFEVVKWLYDQAKKPTGKTGQIESLAVLYGDTPSGLPRQQDKIYSVKGISPTIATFSTPAFDTPEGIRLLTPRECARLQGFPEDFKLPEKDVIAYHQIGNAVSVNVVEQIFLKLLPLLGADKTQDIL